MCEGTLWHRCKDQESRTDVRNRLQLCLIGLLLRGFSFVTRLLAP